MKIPGYALFLVLLVGVTVGSVTAAANLFVGDVQINPGGENGDLWLNGGHLGVNVAPTPGQLIRAGSDSATPAIFLVEGNDAQAVFNMKTTGNQIAALQLTDGEDGTIYRVRVNQPDNAFQIVDLTSGQDVRMNIAANGDICLGSC